MEPELFTLEMTPAMLARLTRVVNDVIQLLQDNTETPEEAFIILDATKRTLNDVHGIVLVGPIDDTMVGQT